MGSFMKFTIFNYKIPEMIDCYNASIVFPLKGNLKIY